MSNCTCAVNYTTFFSEVVQVYLLISQVEVQFDFPRREDKGFVVAFILINNDFSLRIRLML